MRTGFGMSGSKMSKLRGTFKVLREPLELLKIPVFFENYYQGRAQEASRIILPWFLERSLLMVEDSG